ncbi:complement C3-like [Tachyglossus aculeatus]|uniref:complement C3-like n=1 Tax=Tachyglossus aculeatus TaxID=9261 RepID=UPI0018F304D6|nr:complement C3-like [Tachyglossus aculeatus]
MRRLTGSDAALNWRDVSAIKLQGGPRELRLLNAMGSLGFYLATVLALTVAGRASDQSLFTLVTPSVLRVGSKETIVVEAPGVSAPLEVKVRVLDFSQKRTLLDEATARLGPENQGLAFVTVMPPSFT